ncbi:MAG: hypothetical protein ABI378_12860 [Chitinophagaceae bacterium]
MLRIPARYLSIFACISFLAAILLSESSCKKDQLLKSGGELRFSTDTLTFDTVFTSLGSATIGLKIFNPQSEKIVISSVHLANGSSSPFHINVDGKAGDGTNIEIAANDSIYVFATVKVDPTSANSPFIVEDRLVATLNGNDYSVPIFAYGQNAHYIRDSVLATQIWLTDKPYVVFGYAVVDKGQTLTIPAGCRIYMHANARLFVDGTLTAIGTKKDSIIFQGDRLDRSYYGYEGYPGEWGGIYFTQHSNDNYLEHVIIANGGNAAQGAVGASIQVSPDSSSSSTRQLTMSKVIIQNSLGYGLLSFGGTVKAENCLINACGATALALVQGGNYELNNCTFATYGSNKIAHTDNPVAVMRNYFFISQTQYIAAPLSLTMRNCVVAGSLDKEIFIDSVKDAAATVTLQHCLFKTDGSTIPVWVSKSSVQYSLVDGTLDPLFVNASKFDFHEKVGSPLIDSGISYSNMPITDLDEKNRVINGIPDIGCFEFQ